MIRSVAPFRAEHYEWLSAIGPAADYGAMPIGRETLRVVERHNTWTGVVDGDPVAIAGTMQLWPGRHMAWAYISTVAGPHMLWITRETEARLAEVKGRIELTVRADFPEGHRWAKLLGFSVENPPGILRGYGPEGEDHISYVRHN